MAEILVRAKEHWMDAVDRSGWNDQQLAKFNRRKRKGSPIVVMPDGHVWGARECPPDFVIIKLPGIAVETVKYLLEQYTTGDAEDPDAQVVYHRRFHIPANFIQTILDSPYNGVITLNLNINQFNTQHVIDRSVTNIDG